MQLNHVPKVSSNNPTGCCPKFIPRDWDDQTFKFKDKPFVRFTVRSFLYMPLNMGSMITKVMAAVEAADATDKTEHIMLSYDLSPWQSEHYLAVTKQVAGLENVTLSGTYLSKVFEGPFKDAPKWLAQMQEYVAAKKQSAKKIYLSYTMCPKCAKFYGHNYVVALAQL